MDEQGDEIEMESFELKNKEDKEVDRSERIGRLNLFLLCQSTS